MNTTLRRFFRHVPVVLTALALMSFDAEVWATRPIGAYVTYEGSLEDGGAAANGIYDFQFKLFSDPVAGNQIGPAISIEDLFTTGTFTVTLDFGPGAIAGQQRWIQTGVRPGGSTGDFTDLLPRKAVTPVPYAIHSISTDQIVHEFLVARGQSIAAGDAVGLKDGQLIKGFEPGGGGPITTHPGLPFHTIVALSPTKFVGCGVDSEGAGMAMVGEISGNAITFGSAAPTVGGTVAVAALTADRFVVAYSGQCSVGDVVGNQIVMGAPHMFTFNVPVRDLGLATLSETQFALVYGGETGGVGRVQIETIAGTTITDGPEIAFTSSIYSGIGRTSICALGSGGIVVGYIDQNASPGMRWRVIAGSVSGTNITFGAPVPFLEETTGHHMCVSLGAAKFLTAFHKVGDVASNNKQICHVGEVVGNTITLGPAQTLPVRDFSEEIAVLSPTRFISSYSYGIVADVIGTAITPSSFFGYNGRNVAALSPNSWVMDSESWDSSTRIVSIPVCLPIPLGIAKTMGAEGQRIPVILGGVSEVHSSLVVGSCYYAHADGTIREERAQFPEAIRIGPAVSPTEILIETALSKDFPLSF